MLFLLLAACLLLSIPLLSMGASASIVQAMVCCVCIVILISRGTYSKSKSRCVVFLLVLLSIIDKFNDLSSDFDVVAGIGPIFYTIVVTSLFASIKDIEVRLFIRYLFVFSLLSVILGVVIYLGSGNTNFRHLNRDYSAALLLFWIINMWYGKRKRLVTILVFVVNVLLFQARTMIISMLFFLFCYYYLERFSYKKRVWFFWGIIISGIAFVSAGIIVEFLGDAGNTLFSNHGIIWGVAVDQVINADSRFNFLFGYPTTPKALSDVFYSISSFYDNHYIANTEAMMERGHFHCSFVYYLYNTGVVGLLLLILTIRKSLIIKKYNAESFALFGAIFYVSIFNGMSLTGIYVISTIFMISVLVDLPPKGSISLFKL